MYQKSKYLKIGMHPIYNELKSRSTRRSICSDRGVCECGKCRCDEGFRGTMCEECHVSIMVIRKILTFVDFVSGFTKKIKYVHRPNSLIIFKIFKLQT